jgi:cell wall-associated NlpC family hydrolase
MRNTRLLLVLFALAFTLAVVLVKPLPSRADNGEPPQMPPPDQTPSNANPIVPPLPVVTLKPKAVRKPTAALHKALHLPLGDKVVKYAKHFLGVPYVYGGNSPRSGFDCSGLVRFVYAHFGVGLAHSSFAQFRSGVRVTRGGLKPGDLVFFHSLGHVGIYIGGGRFIHAPHAGTRVQIAPLGGWYSGSFDGARRLLRARS